MERRLAEHFASLKQHCEALTDAEFALVTEHLVKHTSDHIDGDTDYPMGRYFYESAAACAAEALNLDKDEEKLADIDMLAFEYNHFM